jgi:hypothetical protein
LRYRFAPLAALESKGPAVAAYLAKLFRRHGAPLFLSVCVRWATPYDGKSGSDMVT